MNSILFSIVLLLRGSLWLITMSLSYLIGGGNATVSINSFLSMPFKFITGAGERLDISHLHLLKR